MLIKPFIGTCLLGSLVGGLSAAAQTGRIAHFGHGGSVATLAAEQAAADNFGEPVPYFVPDSVRYLSSKMALSYGRWHWGGNGSTTDTLKFPESYSPQRAARYTRQLYTRARLIGFDSMSRFKAAAPAAEQPRKGKRSKKAASIGRPLLPPASGRHWGLVVLVALAGAGGLLSGKRRAALPSRA